MTPKEKQRRLLPPLLPLWLIVTAVLVVFGALYWASRSELLPVSWSKWTDLRFLFGYTAAAVLAPALIVDLCVLLIRDRRTRLSEETHPWIAASREAFDAEMPHQQPISQVEAEVTSWREDCYSQLSPRWNVAWVLAVAAAVLSLLCSVYSLRGGAALSDFARPIVVTGGLSVMVILLAAFCQSCNHRLWATWRREMMRIQKTSPRYDYRDLGEPAADGDEDVRVEQEDEEEAAPQIDTGSGPADEPEEVGGWQTEGFDPTRPPEDSPVVDHGDWGVPEQPQRNAEEQPSDRGWGQPSGGGYDV